VQRQLGLPVTHHWSLPREKRRGRRVVTGYLQQTRDNYRTSSTTLSADTPEESDYWTKPTVEELNKLGQEELAAFRDFTVGRVGCGEITFLVFVDLTSLPTLSSIPSAVVILSDRECTVYPDKADKPPQGEGLDGHSHITREKC